jgi:hypothetical protein
MHMKSDVAKRLERAKQQDVKYRETPDIVIKVVCRYRAELFFKISRKTKLARLFNAWTDRMESGALAPKGGAKPAAPVPTGPMAFVFTHAGRAVDAEQTPEEAGIEDGDEVLAVEMMDLTDAGTAEDAVCVHSLVTVLVFIAIAG